MKIDIIDPKNNIEDEQQQYNQSNFNLLEMIVVVTSPMKMSLISKLIHSNLKLMFYYSFGIHIC